MSEPGLRVPKTAVRVDLAIPGASPRPVELFVAEHLSDFRRRQHIIELLEATEAFLPVRDVADGGWLLVSKLTIAWVAFSLTGGNLPIEETDGLEEELFDVRRQVSIALLGGGELQGELLYSMPDDRRRVMDYLNSVGGFLRLWTPEQVYLVNKRFVVSVVELAGGRTV